MGAHLTPDGRFQSDKYPTCPAGKVPLSTRDPDAQDLLDIYAERHRKRDAEFSDDVQAALANDGYKPRPTTAAVELVKQARALVADGSCAPVDFFTRLAAALEVSERQRGLQVQCDVCGDPIVVFGAVLYGPPNAEGRCRKEHFCVKCYEPYLRARALVKEVTKGGAPESIDPEPARLDVYKWLKIRGHGQHFRIKIVANSTGRSYNRTRQILERLVKDRLVERLTIHGAHIEYRVAVTTKQEII